MSEREFDIVLWGATGFTGQLVAEYLLARHGVDGGPRWAPRRPATRASSTRSADGSAPRTSRVVLGDGNDAASMAELAGGARASSARPWAPTPSTAASSSGRAHRAAPTTAISRASSTGSTR